MAKSRHFEVCEAIKLSLEASDELSVIIDKWYIQKRYWNRYSSFREVKSKGFIAPIMRETEPFENLKVKWRLPCLIGVMLPSDGSVGLEENEDELLLVSEYLEDIFAWQGKNQIPPLIKNVGQSYADPNKFHFEGCSVEPSEQYLEVALQNGFDAIGLVVNIDIQFNKKDFSTLGA